MASAYAALLSLFHTLNHIKIHPSPPISLDQSQVESLTQNLSFLKDFLEHYPTYEDDDLESRITTAAYAAEDIIETHIVDRIHARSNIPQGLGRVMDLMKKEGMKIKKRVMKITGADHSGLTSDPQDSGHSGSTSYDINTLSIDLHQALEGVIQDMDLIKTEVMHIIPGHLHTNSTAPLSPAASTLQSTTMPVFDDAIIIQLLDKLTGQQTGLNIIPIVGMGGIGKTTLAKYIYAKPLILQHFDTLAWVTISQVYSRRNILQLLCQEVKVSKTVSSEMSEDEIGIVLFQHLCGRRYLIVLDDIWSVEAWYMIKSYFPDHNNGSRIMITTRPSNLASELSGSHIFQMQFLDEDKSWCLLCETVFGKQDCPTEFEDIGKQIARKCRGLPLSIVVIGGLLKKSNMTRAYWMYTLENLNSLVNLENDEYAFRILRTSYKDLPMHLKPCFLYMGIFPEDEKIRASVLIKLWVAEGIVRPNEDKTLEEVARDYLKDLINRNLILVSKLRWDGEAKLCGIHDVLRDLCVREAQKVKFFCVVRQQKHHSPPGINMERRICISNENAEEGFNSEFLHAMECASLNRSLLYCMHADGHKDSPSVHLGLLRVYSSVDGRNGATHSNNAIFKHANLRFLSLNLKSKAGSSLRSMCSLVWNLQTLKVGHPDPFLYRPMMAPSEIWEMPLLKHVMLYNFVLPDPPNGEHNFALKNLQTLCIMNFKFSEVVIKRISNVKKLKVKYRRSRYNEKGLSTIKNIGHLQKLESLYLDVRNMRNLASFPRTLKKLSLLRTELSWEELTMRIGSLPLLQFLKLGFNACRGPKWETVEGQFCNLRVLEIWYCQDLKYWDTDSTHFPRLEHLILRLFFKLEEIPSSIGDIPTLKSIRLEGCNESAEESAERIKKEQDDNGNEDLEVVVGFVGILWSDRIEF